MNTAAVSPLRRAALRAGLTVICLTAAGPRLPAQESEPVALARALQQKYDTVRDFSASFVQTYEGGVLRRKVTESGDVLVKKPARMRWTYTKPENKVFVADGVRMYSYIPADRQVYVARVPADDEATTPALFLAGKGNLLRDFEVSAGTLPADAPEGSVALALAPRITERDYDTLTLVVDRASLRLRMLIADDRQGGRSTFTFTDMRENIGVKDREFEFKVPSGVEVITQGTN